MKTLHLNLKKQWFDLISSGEKTEEYRELKPYWASRLTTFKGTDFMNLLNVPVFSSKPFDVITFKNGYAKNAPTYSCKYSGLTINKGKSEWGAEIDEYYFVIKLGEKI